MFFAARLIFPTQESNEDDEEEEDGCEYCNCDCGNTRKYLGLKSIDYILTNGFCSCNTACCCTYFFLF